MSTDELSDIVIIATSSATLVLCLLCIFYRAMSSSSTSSSSSEANDPRRRTSRVRYVYPTFSLLSLPSPYLLSIVHYSSDSIKNHLQQIQIPLQIIFHSKLTWAPLSLMIVSKIIKSRI
jgi:hypothetical protein